MAVAVCISTLTTYQHVIVDVIGGVLLAELAYHITANRKIADLYWQFIKSVAGFSKKLFVKIRGTKC